MKTRMLLSGMIVGASVFLSAGIGMAAGDNGAESMVLKGGRMGSITFSHVRHQGIFVDCKPCHDLFPKEPQIVDKLKAEGKLKEKDVMNMCKKCHKDLAGKGQKTGPTSCNDCHKK